MPPSALRVLLVGDHSGGKSTLSHGLEFGGPPMRPPRATVGCTLTIIQSFGSTTDADFIVELREVGGHPFFAPARGVFFRDFDAVICVFDASSNDTTPEKKWVDELTSHIQWGVDDFRRYSDDQETGLTSEQPDHSIIPHHNILWGVDSARVSWIRRPEGFVPLLLVGNKIDTLVSAPDRKHGRGSGRRSDAVFISALDPQLDTRPFHDFFLLALAVRDGVSAVSGRNSNGSRNEEHSTLAEPLRDPPRPTGSLNLHGRDRGKGKLM
jgi:GTPase SAR1 family protein